MTYYSTRRQIVSADPIPLDTLAARFPTIGATHGAPSLSPRYAHIGTLDVLRGLESEGWQVHSAMTALARSPDRAPYAKHMIRMRTRNPAMPEKIGDSVPELVLVNGHDGSSSYQLSGGLLRLVCLNGLLVGTSFATFRVNHIGRDLTSRVIDASYTVVGQFEQVAAHVESMQATRLTADDQREFATRALQLRYGGESPFAPESILSARRSGDVGADLWTTYNCVQENVMRGGARGVRVNRDTGKARATSIRAVSGIDAGVRLNRGLWDIAESYLPAGVAA